MVVKLQSQVDKLCKDSLPLPSAFSTVHMVTWLFYLNGSIFYAQ